MLVDRRSSFSQISSESNGDCEFVNRTSEVYKRTKKNELFNSEKDSYKNFSELDIICIAGIGRAYSKILKINGFSKLSDMMGQLLILKKNEEYFIDWLNMLGIDMHNAGPIILFY
ncbi:barrier to autointegration factor [Brachionus plicatilis]|uniref:Barrier to autointegration factor n=1 Tax=Brachionus plicatilis TaxID=10195 RepID=A0A3M7PU27_BRAPC|nr:barrier to autointegration factor [Brachionus plicatilis]